MNFCQMISDVTNKARLGGIAPRTEREKVSGCFPTNGRKGRDSITSRTSGTWVAGMLGQGTEIPAFDAGARDKGESVWQAGELPRKDSFA